MDLTTVKKLVEGTKISLCGIKSDQTTVDYCPNNSYGDLDPDLDTFFQLRPSDMFLLMSDLKNQVSTSPDVARSQ